MSSAFYSNSIFNVSVLSNAVAGYAVPGALIPGMPPLPSIPTAPGAANPGPAWRGQFGKHSSQSQPSVLYDSPLVVIVTPPAIIPASQEFIANPGPAWDNRFGFASKKSKSSVLYDKWTLNFSGFFSNASGDLAFGANTVGYVNALPSDPPAILPSPAWENRFFPEKLAKQAVLFDYQLSFAGKQSPVIALGAITQGFPYIQINDPSQASAGPAWQNQFLPERLTKQAVLFDYQLSIAGSYVNPSGDLGFNASSTGNQGFNHDPPALQPSPAWQNVFSPGRIKKNIVLNDSQLAILGPYCFTGTNETILFDGYGGTAVLASLDSSDGGTAADANSYGGTAADANAGLGGSEINDLLGGTAADANEYGGLLFGGCYD